MVPDRGAPGARGPGYAPDVSPLPLRGQGLTLADVADVARGARRVSLADDARARMRESEAWVASVVDGTDPQPVYGVNTGFGSLARVRIPTSSTSRLSYNLMVSHAAGVGAPVADDVVRAMILLRANALAKGASGCRPALVDTLCAMLDHGVIPEIPSQGSCGSSGDLAPLAHLALVVFRRPDGDDDPAWSGNARLRGERVSGFEAMRRAGIARLRPEAKDGLAITNGAQLSTAFAALAAHDAAGLVAAAEIAAAMSWEAMRGVSRALHPGVQALRPYAGAVACASDLRRLIAGSTLVDSIPDKVQDAYALRCTPQVLGAVRDGVTFARAQIGVEVNAATDNPVILLDAEGANKAFSGGLFHGEPVGMAADHLKLACSELAALSERRLFRLTTGSLSARLPPLLADGRGPGMGLMSAQTTAAALVSECRSLGWPASADSIPTCEDQEDHVAMATTAARRCADVVALATRVVAVELLGAARGLGWRLAQDADVRLGEGTAVAFSAVRDRLGGGVIGDDIEALAAAIGDGSLVRAVEAAVGPLASLEGAG